MLTVDETGLVQLGREEGAAPVEVEGEGFESAVGEREGLDIEAAGKVAAGEPRGRIGTGGAEFIEERTRRAEGGGQELLEEGGRGLGKGEVEFEGAARKGGPVGGAFEGSARIIGAKTLDGDALLIKEDGGGGDVEGRGEAVEGDGGIANEETAGPGAGVLFGSAGEAEVALPVAALGVGEQGKRGGADEEAETGFEAADVEELGGELEAEGTGEGIPFGLEGGVLGGAEADFRRGHAPDGAIDDDAGGGDFEQGFVGDGEARAGRPDHAVGGDFAGAGPGVTDDAVEEAFGGDAGGDAGAGFAAEIEEAGEGEVAEVEEESAAGGLEEVAEAEAGAEVFAGGRVEGEALAGPIEAAGESEEVAAAGEGEEALGVEAFEAEGEGNGGVVPGAADGGLTAEAAGEIDTAGAEEEVEGVEGAGGEFAFEIELGRAGRREVDGTAEGESAEALGAAIGAGGFGGDEELDVALGGGGGEIDEGVAKEEGALGVALLEIEAALADFDFGRGEAGGEESLDVPAGGGAHEVDAGLSEAEAAGGEAAGEEGAEGGLDFEQGDVGEGFEGVGGVVTDDDIGGEDGGTGEELETGLALDAHGTGERGLEGIDEGLAGEVGGPVGESRGGEEEEGGEPEEALFHWEAE